MSTVSFLTKSKRIQDLEERLEEGTPMTLCSEKTSYTTEAAAMQAAQGRVTNAPLRLFVYRCACGFFHLTKRHSQCEVKVAKHKPKDIAKHFFEIRTRY
jgi:hypothetical protein